MTTYSRKQRVASATSFIMIPSAVVCMMMKDYLEEQEIARVGVCSRGLLRMAASPSSHMADGGLLRIDGEHMDGFIASDHPLPGHMVVTYLYDRDPATAHSSRSYLNWYPYRQRLQSLVLDATFGMDDLIPDLFTIPDGVSHRTVLRGFTALKSLEVGRDQSYGGEVQYNPRFPRLYDFHELTALERLVVDDTFAVVNLATINSEHLTTLDVRFLVGRDCWGDTNQYGLTTPIINKVMTRLRSLVIRWDSLSLLDDVVKPFVDLFIDAADEQPGSPMYAVIGGVTYPNPLTTTTAINAMTLPSFGLSSSSSSLSSNPYDDYFCSFLPPLPPLDFITHMAVPQAVPIPALHSLTSLPIYRPESPEPPPYEPL